MAFSFGAPAAAAPAPAFGAPAAATPAPAFGAPAAPAPAFGAAPAPAPGGLFGSTPAPAPAPGGLFGSTTPAPAPGGLFGSTTPAPASGGLFGSTAPAPAPGGLFGSTTPAPAPGGLFGSTAPAPGGLFGAKAPAPAFGAAPAGGGLFGSAPAPGGLFGSTTPAPAPGGLFGAPSAAPSAFGAAPTAAPAAANLAGYMPYSSLPQDQKNNLDTVHQAIMNHKRTILAVSTMAPNLLDASTQQADMAGGKVPLSVTVQRLNGQVQQLENDLRSLHSGMMHTKQLYETSTTQAIRDAKWPTEFVATRVGATLTANNESKDRNANTANTGQSSKEDKQKTEEMNRRLKELLDREMTHTDQIYRMPSPYLWQCVEEMEGRSLTLQGQLQSLKDTLDISNQVSTEDFDVESILQLQEQTIWKVAADLTRVHAKMDELRQLYNLHERGINVLEEARHREAQYQRQKDQQVRTLMVKTLPSTVSAPTGAPAPGTSLFGSAPAPAGGSLFGTPSTGTTSLFGKSPAPAPGTSLFGSTAPAPGGSLFGSTAPAPAGGSLFGSTTPAPAPASGGLFGSTTPAPAPGGLFGSKAPAPAFGAPTPAAPAFGATPAPAAPAFGATPAPAAPAFGAAPAPATGGLFGAAPAPGGLFGSTTAATPKSKSKRNGSRRR